MGLADIVNTTVYKTEAIFTFLRLCKLSQFLTLVWDKVLNTGTQISTVSPSFYNGIPDQLLVSYGHQILVTQSLWRTQWSKFMIILSQTGHHQPHLLTVVKHTWELSESICRILKLFQFCNLHYLNSFRNLQNKLISNVCLIMFTRWGWWRHVSL